MKKPKINNSSNMYKMEIHVETEDKESKLIMCHKMASKMKNNMRKPKKHISS